jgi:kumamolisin
MKMQCRTNFRRGRTPFPGYTPQQLATARGWNGKPVNAAPVKLGYLSLGGVTPPSDIAAMANRFGLPMPKVTVIGTPQSPDPNGADVENCLDTWIAWMWSVWTGLTADLTIAFCDNDENGIQNGFNLLRQAGVQAASCSWGSPETGWSSASLTSAAAEIAAWKSAGIWPGAASGDNSEDDGTNIPQLDALCCLPDMIAVGGTLLSQSGERAWGDGRPGDDGGGGGFSRLFTQPSYQSGIVNSRMRGAPDVAEIADPAGGAMMCCNGQWMCVGGTSLATPAFMGQLAVVRGAMLAAGKPLPGDIHNWLYSTPNITKDITTGSNGLPAAAGWDPTTGLGTPVIAAMIAAMTGGTIAGSPPPPVTVPPGPIQPPPIPVSTFPTISQLDALLAAIASRYPQYARLLQLIETLGDDFLQRWEAMMTGRGPVRGGRRR